MYVCMFTYFIKLFKKSIYYEKKTKKYFKIRKKKNKFEIDTIIHIS